MFDDVIVPFKPSRWRWITATAVERNGKPRVPRGRREEHVKASTKLYSFPADAPSGLRNEGAEDARCSRSSIARKGEEDTFPSRIPILYNASRPVRPGLTRYRVPAKIETRFFYRLLA